MPDLDIPIGMKMLKQIDIRGSPWRGDFVKPDPLGQSRNGHLSLYQATLTRRESSIAWGALSTACFYLFMSHHYRISEIHGEWNKCTSRLPSYPYNPIVSFERRRFSAARYICESDQLSRIVAK